MEGRTQRGSYKKVPVNLDEVYIDTSLSPEQRIQSFLKQVKNPYLVKIDGVVVEMEYTDGGCSIENAIALAVSMDE